jgi:hypothetical protein
LNDAVSVMEKYIGHDADVVQRLQQILKNARDIKQVIQKVGEQMAPSSAHTQRRQGDRRRALVAKRILVVDSDEQVRQAAHALLERSGCTVETADLLALTPWLDWAFATTKAELAVSA